MSSHQGGWEGLTAKFVVGNRAQRCERHKLGEFWWVGGVWSCVQIMSCCHFGQDNPARNFEDLPPTQRCVGSVYSEGLRIGSASVQQLYTNVISSGRVGGTHCKVCGINQRLTFFGGDGKPTQREPS